MSRVLAVLLALTLWGCATGVPSTSVASEEAEIRGLEEEERTAILNRDPVTLQRIWAPEFIVNSPVNRVSPSRAAVLDLVQRGTIHYSTFERRIEEVRIISGTAVVMGAETVVPAAPGARPVQRRFTHIWQREAASWRLVARHANDIAVR